MMREIWRAFWGLSVAGLLMLALAGVAVAQGGPRGRGSSAEEDAKDFGFYRENTLDMEVKVQGGAIRIYRSWRGDKQEWSINPQHKQLSFSDETEGSAYGRLLAKEISRGSTSFSLRGGSPGVYGKGTAISNPSIPERNASIKAPGGQVPPTVVSLTTAHGVNYCTAEGEAAAEIVTAQPTGFRWADKVGRKWSDFDEEGHLLSWGDGNYRTAQVLYDSEQKVSGYADTNDHQVISISRDANGRIQQIADDTGATITYTYYPNGQLHTVLDADNVLTTYQYNSEGHISRKTFGDASGAPGDQVIGEETTLQFDYYPNGELKSELTQDGTRRDYSYEYDDRLGFYTTTETASGNRIMTTVFDQLEGLLEVRKNSSISLRLIYLCEDSAILDRHNRVTYIDRDAIGIVRAVYFPDGRILRLQHSNENWPELGNPWDSPTRPWGVVKATFPSGTEVNYERDPDGNIRIATEVTSSGETRTWRFDYDDFGNRTEQRLQSSNSGPDNGTDRIEKWEYDAFGNIAHHEDVFGRRFRYRYNRRGDLTKLIGPDGKEWNFTYNRKGQLLSFTDPRGYREEYRYTRRGLLRKILETHTQGQAPAETTLFYNHRGLVSKVVDPFGESWRYQYNGAGEVETIIDPLGKTETYGYDHYGRMKRFEDGNGVAVNIQYWDSSQPGQAPQTSIPFSPFVQIEYPTYTEEITYDMGNRLKLLGMKPNDPQSAEAEYTQWDYDLDGRVKRLVRPDQFASHFEWDQLGRLTSLTEPGRGTSTRAYPNAESVTQYNDPVGGTITHNFNQLGELTSEVRADQTQVNFTYNAYGSIKTYTNARGNKHEFFYNDAQQVREIQIFATASATTPLRTITYQRNLRGDITGYSDGTISIAFTLDAIGRVLSATTNYGSFSKTHSYTYTANGLPETYTAVNGVTYTYSWDAANQFQGLLIPGEGLITYTYNDTDWYQPDSVVFPGGLRQSYEYDDLRHLKRIHSTDQGGNTLLDYNYNYQKGPLSGAVIDQMTTEHGQYDFDYDSAFRLTNVIQPNAPNEAWAYDALDRRQPATGTAWTYNANGAVESTGDTAFTYDNDGNLQTRSTGGVTTHFLYDESDRLSRVEQPSGTTIAEYGYDHFGRRIWKEVSGTRTYYAYTPEGLAAEMDSSGNVQRSYLYAPGSYWSTDPLTMQIGSSYYYFHNDHIGTPRKITDESGAVVWEATYDAFGEATVASSSSITNNLRFPGQYYDAETQLHHNYFRNYDPALGTYLEQDPYGVAFTGANRYGYAAGNPVSYFDPTGELAPLAVIGSAALWIGLEALTGFPTLVCAEGLYEGLCTDPRYLDACFNTAVEAVLSLTGGRLISLTFDGVSALAKGLRGRLSSDSLQRALRTLHLDDESGVLYFGGRKRAAGRKEFKGHPRVPIPRQLKNRLITSEKLIAQRFRLSRKEVGRRLHNFKRSIGDNSDIYVDKLNGDVYDQRSLEHIGNILDDY